MEKPPKAIVDLRKKRDSMSAGDQPAQANAVMPGAESSPARTENPPSPQSQTNA
jgi:hypothetical protein